MFYVYAISSLIKNYIYVGQTENLQDRLTRHNNRWERTTRAYSPFKLLYVEECIDRKTARIREKYWKSGTGKEQLKKMEK